MSYIPQYSLFNHDTLNPYLNRKSLLSDVPRQPNPYWESYGIRGIFFGSFLALLGISMIPIEVTRIIHGSLNRLTTGSYILYPNYNWDLLQNNALIKNFGADIVNGQPNLANKGIVPFSAIGKGVNNYPIQDKYLWPWSHAALLFSLVISATGVLGVLSGFRGTYSSIFAFFTLAMLSSLLCIFLVAYYSTHIHWQIHVNRLNRLAFYSHNLDFALGLVMLILSAISWLVSAATAFLCAYSLGIGCGSKASLVKNKMKDYKNNFFMPSGHLIQANSFF